MKRIFALNSKNGFVWFTLAYMFVGLLYFNWSPYAIVLAYVFETVIIGVLQLVKMGATAPFEVDDSGKRVNIFAGLFIMIFFSIHYFAFVAGQLLFVMIYFNNTMISSTEEEGWLMDLIKETLSNRDIWYAYGIIVLGNIYYVISSFFIPKKYKSSKVSVMMFEPYGRIVVQQIVVIFGAMFMTLFGTPTAVAILLILVKSAVDLAGVSLMDIKNKGGM